MINRLRQADHTILLLNLLLLMTAGIRPFATELMAKHLHELAAAVYGAAFLFMAVASGCSTVALSIPPAFVSTYITLVTAPCWPPSTSRQAASGREAAASDGAR